jgi:hypothetical protein
MDVNTILMHSTFKIAGKDSLGTAFIIGRPIPGESQKLFCDCSTCNEGYQGRTSNPLSSQEAR